MSPRTSSGGKGGGTAMFLLFTSPPQCLLHVLLGCKCMQAQRNDGFFSRHAFLFPLTFCLWNFQSVFFFFLWTYLKANTSFLSLSSELLCSPFSLKVSGCPRKFMYVPRAVFMFISGKKGEIACTLPEWIHSATHTTRKGIQNDRFSEQLLRSPRRPAV